ncbi:MAG: family 16 glycoside hydrolase [Verrucomicrobiota bacterium]
MKLSFLLFSLLITVAVAFQSAAASPEKIKTLIITGGHGFDREPFFKLFVENPDITFSEARHGKENASAYEREDLLDQQVVVLYDMPRQITEAQKARFRALFDKGIGVLVLHHALVSFQDWPDYENIIGGRYPENAAQPGRITAEVGYEHDVEVPIVIAARDHPVTAGLNDFVLHDEIYWGYRVRPDVTPLLTTSLPKSGKPLAWARTEGNSRLVYIQPGHGPQAFSDSNYRRLIAQSIRWVAKQSSNADWTEIFDGKSLEGWVQRGGKAEYRVEDGQIIGVCVPNTPNSFLCTQRQFTNFVLELEFKVDPGLNSGVQIRSEYFDAPVEFDWNGRHVRVAARRVHGLQVEIDTSKRAWSGGLYEEGARGWLKNLADNEPARTAFRQGDWNQFRIECRGDSIRTWINEVPAAELRDDRVPAGFIGLQVHGVGNNDRKREVRFRRIRLKEL